MDFAGHGGFPVGEFLVVPAIGEGNLVSPEGGAALCREGVVGMEELQGAFLKGDGFPMLFPGEGEVGDLAGGGRLFAGGSREGKGGG